MANPLDHLRDELEAPVAIRKFGSGWYSGFFALVLAIAGFGLVVALRWPGWFATPELQTVEKTLWFRPVVHSVLISSYALALLSLMLRTKKAIGFTALAIGIAAALLGGANVSPRETHDWGIFFGVDFFVVNLIAAGLMFAPIERFWPHNRDQRLFRTEWREDLFYYLLSSMLVQVFTYLALAPSSIINANTVSLAGIRAAIGGQPWVLQFVEAMLLTDFVQYWFHRAFHRVPFLWGFHAVHHSAKAMDWLAGARMHFVEIILLRSVTSLPLLTFGFLPSVMQAYVALVYIYSGLVHANLKGDFDRFGHFMVTPRFHHWHHGLEAEAVDVNFAIHFPLWDKLFGTFHLPAGRWPQGYGIPEKMPRGYWRQLAYPFVRSQKAIDAGKAEAGH
ncbi:sterol desaturase family protein [Sphingomonas asaccharolytica]|uniref:sterol desaturase family protein n=1 Tax=Sphingomonas asaccharolytica TaxID=40681 RepID=UPI00082E29CB|nr:sterol desaturase family protein [Sphingomonas asaccharolytica]